MPSIRIAAAGAALLLFSGLTAGGVAAQTATDQAPGKPLQLLHWLHATSPAKSAEHQAARQNSREEDHPHRGRGDKTPAGSVGNRSGNVGHQQPAALNSATPAEATAAATPETMMAPTPQPAFSRDQLVPK